MTHLPKSRLAAGFWLLLAAGLVAYHLALVFAGIAPNLVSRPLHMAFILPFALVFGVTAKGRFYSGWRSTRMPWAINPDFLRGAGRWSLR